MNQKMNLREAQIHNAYRLTRGMGGTRTTKSALQQSLLDNNQIDNNHKEKVS